MAHALPTCPACDEVLSVAEGGAVVPCPRCGAATETLVFPALYGSGANLAQAADSLPGESTCFHHPGRVAVVACAGCGRFLCALCDLDLGDRHVCPACLHAEHRVGGPVGRSVSRIVQYDSLALALALIPPLSLIFWILSLFAAPAAVFLAIRFWRRPMSLLPRSRVRFALALIAGLATIVGWITIVYLGVSEMFSHAPQPPAGAS
jgi:hypothetical protein